jgi:hypothetical protein
MGISQCQVEELEREKDHADGKTDDPWARRPAVAERGATRKGRDHGTPHGTHGERR